MNTDRIILSEENIFVIWGAGPSNSGNTRIKMVVDIPIGETFHRGAIHFYMKPNGERHFPNQKKEHNKQTLSPANPKSAEREWEWVRNTWKGNANYALTNLKGEQRKMAIALAIEVWNEWAAETRKNVPLLEFKSSKKDASNNAAVPASPRVDKFNAKVAQAKASFKEVKKPEDIKAAKKDCSYGGKTVKGFEFLKGLLAPEPQQA